MNRLDRLTSILIQLQSKRLITAREMAERFEVTNRTIYRDIQYIEACWCSDWRRRGEGLFFSRGLQVTSCNVHNGRGRALVTTSKIFKLPYRRLSKQNYESALLKIKSRFTD